MVDNSKKTIVGGLHMRKQMLLMLIVMISIALVACNSVKYNPNSSTTQKGKSKLSTKIGAKSPSQTVELKTQNSASKPEVSLTNESTPIPNEGAKADNFYIEEIVSSYEQLLAYAVNDNDFALIKNLLMSESNIYQSQEKFVTEQFDKGIKYTLIDIYPEEIKQGSKKYEYKAYITANIEISGLNKGKETKEFKRIYTVIDDGKIRKITDIQE